MRTNHLVRLGLGLAFYFGQQVDR